MKSKRTKDCVKRRNVFGVISYTLWLGTIIFLVFSAFSRFGSAEEAVESTSTEIISESAKAFLLSLSTTVIIGIVATILIKDKLRTAFWMASVVMAAIMYNSVGMYVVLVIWLLDEYIFHNLMKYYANKVSINKEIDLRNEG